MSDDQVKPTPDDTMGHNQPATPPAQPVDVGAQEDPAKDPQEGRRYH